MEQSNELRLADIRKTVLEQPQNNELYIPLHGKHTTNPEEEPFDLAEKIRSFFVFNDSSNHDPKVMLLMGGTGSGKSVFSQQLHQQLWRVYKTGDPIPLWIPLPELQNPFECAVEEVLPKYGFNDLHISEMKNKERFIFVVDGYDELHQFQNCYVTNQWEKWNAKVLITCRSQALYYQADYEKYFMPFNGERRLPLLLRKLYVAAFSEEQIGSYVKQYQQLNVEHKISEEDFSKVPGLTELIKTPFLLHLAVEALPDILAGQVDDEKITQAKLYDVFIERWFTRQVKKLSTAGLLKDTEQKTKQQFWDYCKKLAQQMHEKEVSVISYRGQKVGARLFGKPTQNSLWAPFFNEETELVRSACPLRRYGEHHYGFVHASMVEYFATRAMYEEILGNRHKEDEQYLEEKGKEKEDGDNRIESLCDTNLPRAGIHQRLFSLERQSIQFLADRIEMSEAFKQKMLMILEASKNSKYYAMGAANAITALVRAGVTFNGANLSGINISGADINGGYFDRADLSNSDLTHVQMSHVWLSEANIKGSQLDNINFGEYPWYKHDKTVWSFNYQEDISRLVVGSDDEIVLWDTETGKELRVIKGHKGFVYSVAFSWNGKFIVSGSKDKTVRIWEVKDGTLYAVLEGHEYTVKSVAFSSNDKLIASGSHDNTVRIWEVLTCKELMVLREHEEAVNSVAFSPDGELVVSGSCDKTVRIWKTSNGNLLKVFRGHEAYIESVAFSSDGGRVVSGSSDHTVRVWNVESEKEIRVLRGHDSMVNCVAFSSDGERVLSSSDDRTIRIWEIASGKVSVVLHGHRDGVSHTQFSRNEKQIISVGSFNDMTVRFWDIMSAGLPVRIQGHYGGVSCLNFSQDGKYVVSASADKILKIWEVGSGKAKALLQGHEEAVNSVQFSRNGGMIVSGSGLVNLDNTVRIWDVETRKELFILQGHKKSVRSVVFSISNDLAASVSEDKTIRIWEVASGREIAILRGHKGVVSSVAFSPDDKRLVTGSHDKTLRVWDIARRKTVSVLLGHNAGVNAVALSPDGLKVLSGGSDNTVRVWEMDSGKEIAFFLHSGRRCCVQFSHDGMRAIVGSEDIVRIWNISTLECVTVLKLHNIVEDCSYHANGRLLVGLGDGVIECWRNIGNESNFHWHLCWSTDLDSRALNVDGLQASNVIGLSTQNRRLMEQRGAIINTKLERHSNNMTPLIVQRAGSPIHHKPGYAIHEEEVSNDGCLEESSDVDGHSEESSGLHTDIEC